MRPEGPLLSQRRLLRQAVDGGGVLAASDLANGSDPVVVKERQWDALRLEQAGLLESIGAGEYLVTPEGRAAAGFDHHRRLPELAKAFRALQEELQVELVRRIHAAPPDFFESLIVDLLWVMGYGGNRRDLARRIGRSRDGGVDGLVDRDELGLDTIYVQAKRYQPGNAVPLADIRDFAGSLDAHRATKGVFVTTSHFSTAAAEFCRQLSRRVALIDAKRLAALMVRYGLGVKLVETWQIKKIDEDYFVIRPPIETPDTSSASIQPRK